MGFHTLDLVIFGAGLLGVIHLAIQCGPSLPTRIQQLQDSMENYGDTSSDASIETSCWTPSQFVTSHLLYASKVCQSKFTNFLLGRSTAEAEGIFPVIDQSQLPSNSSQSTEDFAMAMDIVQSSLGRAVGLGVLRDGFWYATHMAAIICGFMTLVIVGFVIAVCFSRAALMHGCLLQAAWRSSQDSFREGEVKGAVPPDQPSMVAARLSKLANSNTLSASYLVFVVSLLLIFGICGGFLATGSKLLTPQEADYSPGFQGEEALSKVTREGREGSQGHQEGASMSQNSSRDSGVFLCAFTIRDASLFHNYVIQCHYEVSKKSNGVHSGTTGTLLEIKHALEASCWLAFLMAFLLTLQAVNHFVLSPRSHQKTMLPIMRHLGVAVSSGGLWFGLTDLYFVSTYVSLGDNAQ